MKKTPYEFRFEAYSKHHNLECMSRISTFKALHQHINIFWMKISENLLDKLNKIVLWLNIFLNMLKSTKSTSKINS